MKDEWQEYDLLDRLTKAADCSYLSDLHNPTCLPSVCKAISKLHADDYTVREWNEAVHYITGENAVFGKASDAQAFLIQYGDEKKK